MFNHRKIYRIAVVYKRDLKPFLIGNDEFEQQNKTKSPEKYVHQTLGNFGHVTRLFPITDLTHDISVIRQFNPHVVFNLYKESGIDTENNMYVTSLWELLEIPYTGSAPLSIGISQNKLILKKLLESKRITTLDYQIYKEIPQKLYLEYPLILRPIISDWNMGMRNNVVHNFQQLKSRVSNLIKHYRQPVIAEHLKNGREFVVSIIEDDIPRCLPIHEVNIQVVAEKNVNTSDGVERQLVNNSKIYSECSQISPAFLTLDLYCHIEDLALQIFKLFMGRDYALIHLLVTPLDKIYVLDYIANPDLSEDSIFNQIILSEGIKFKDFVSLLIKQSLVRGHNVKNKKINSQRQVKYL